MKKTTRKNIKGYVQNGAATDITNYTYKQITELLHNCDTEKIFYSTGVYGINGGLIQDRKTGEMYAVTARNSALLMIF